MTTPASPSPPSTDRQRRGALGALAIFVAGAAAGTAIEWQWSSVTRAWSEFQQRRRGHRRWPDADAPVIPGADQGRLALFLLAGQSNMSGRGELDRHARPTTAPVYVFGNDYRWHRAIEPVDNGRNQIDRVSFDVVVGVGPALAFGERWSELNPEIPVGLIPCAMGGTSIADWQRQLDESTLYGSVLKRCRAASPQGTLQGVLFAQGESDATADRVDLWKAGFERWATDLRADLGRPDLPLVYAQLGDGRRTPDPAAWQRLSAIQAGIHLRDSAMVATNDLPLSDGIHFTAEASRELGRRMADAMHALTSPRFSGPPQ